MYDYFYGQQAELFSFYRVPKVLFTDEKFSNISSDAKLLYGIMLDRMNLSAKNGWVDELGRVYIIFTIEEVKGALGCAEKKAVKLLHELENKSSRFIRLIFPVLFVLKKSVQREPVFSSMIRKAK